MDWIADEKGIHTQEQWYQVKLADILDIHYAGFLHREYGANMYKALQTIYNEYEWHPWLFQHVSETFWEDDRNLRTYYDWLTEQLHIDKQEDMYRIQWNDITENRGAGLLFHHKHIAASVTAAYPEFTWYPWLFSHTPSKYWNSVSNQRKYFDWIGENLQIGSENLNEWYRVKWSELREIGDYIFRFYGGSLLHALKAVYPEHQWYPWLFRNCPQEFWLDHNNIKQYIEWLANKLGISELDQWYEVQPTHVFSLGGCSVLRKENMLDVLKRCYPHHPWNEDAFSYYSSSTLFSQSLLARVLKEALAMSSKYSTVYITNHE